jgi:pimeloyl-ACP methyl ester carboxylesterase
VTSAILDKTNLKMVDVNGRSIFYLEKGTGFPTIYLHGFADVHGVAGDFLPFHDRLAGATRLIAPAHPGCSGTGDLTEGYGAEDAVFHYLEFFDAMGIKEFNLIGHSAGGWIAAEIAVRYPDRVRKLGLIGAAGLFVSGEYIADIFMHTQPERGVEYASLRKMLFSSADAPLAQRYYPDGRGDLDEETRRYEMIRFASFIGFKPPYLYNRSLIGRLHRAKMPVAVVWGEKDSFVPRAHGEAYAAGLSGAGKLKVIAGAGHAAQMEAPDAVADIMLELIKQ